MERCDITECDHRPACTLHEGKCFLKPHHLLGERNVHARETVRVGRVKLVRRQKIRRVDQIIKARMHAQQIAYSAETTVPAECKTDGVPNSWRQPASRG